MSRPSIQSSFPLVFESGKDYNIEQMKVELSPFEQLRNTYFLGFDSFCNLVKDWSKGDAFISKTQEDQEFFTFFVFDVVSRKIKKNRNCAVKKSIELLDRGDTYSVAKHLASHSRNRRERNRCAIAAASAKAWEEEENLILEIWGEEEIVEQTAQEGIKTKRKTQLFFDFEEVENAA
jgi:hypothetical protein